MGRSMMMNNIHIRCFSAAFGKNVSEVTIGVPKETFPNERRVALSPEATQRLAKLGFKINIEAGAGKDSDFSDKVYQDAGAKIVGTEEALKADLVLKVRAPTE